MGRADCAKGRSSEGERSRSDEGDAEDRENKCRKRGDSTVLVADSGDVAQEVPMGAQELPVEEQQEDMVVTLSATATPPVSGTNPDIVMVSKVGGGSDVAAEGVHGEGRCEPPASKPGKRRGRPPKDSSKRKKMEDGSKEADNSSFAHVDQSGKDVALDACEEVGVAPSRVGRGRKTISKLQSSFLPDVTAPSEVSAGTEPGASLFTTCLILPLPSPPPAPRQGTVHVEGIPGTNHQVQSTQTPQGSQGEAVTQPCLCPSPL